MKAKIYTFNDEQDMKRSEVLRTSILYSQEVKWLNYIITKSHTSVIALIFPHHLDLPHIVSGHEFRCIIVKYFYQLA